jgi:hypothetical protein
MAASGSANNEGNSIIYFWTPPHAPGAAAVRLGMPGASPEWLATATFTYRD